MANNYAVSIDSFYYNISALPGNSSVKVQFSQNNTTWFSSAGGSGLWDTLSTTGGASLSLSALGWSGAAFYYKLQLNSTSDFTGTPVVDDVRLDYTPSGGFMFDTTRNLGIGTFDPTAKLTVVSSGTGTGTAFSVMNNAAASLMTILDNGKVGIGATVPSAMLHASSTSATTITAILQGTVAQTANLLENRNNAGTFLSGFTASGGLLLNIASTTALTVQNGSGNAAFVVDSTNSRVGVATSTPGGTYGEKLTVVGGAYFSQATTTDSLYVGGKLTVGTTLSTATTTITGNLTVQDSGGVNTRLFVNNLNGNVGIGTTTPAAKLEVKAGTGDGATEIARLSNTGGSTANRADLKFYTRDGVVGTIGGGNVAASTLGLAFFGGDSTTATDVPHLFIKSTGNVGIATTSPGGYFGEKLTVNGTASVLRSTGGLENLLVVGSTTSANILAVKSNGNVGIGTATPDYKLRVEGSLFINNSLTDKISNVSWTNPSDLRLKDIVGSFDYSLDKLMQLNPIRYTFKADNPYGASPSDQHIGFIAQDVQSVIPEAVSVGNDGYLRFTADTVFWTMLNSIKQINQVLNVASAPTSAPTLKVTASGNVGIGTTNPGAKLEVNAGAVAAGTDVLIIRADTGSGTSVKFKVAASGQIFSDYGTTVTAGADLAEMTKVIGSRGDYPVGTLVAISLEGAPPGSSEDMVVEKTAKPYQGNLVGVVTDRGAFTGGLIGADSRDLMALGTEGYLAKYNAVKVGLIGYVKVRVTDLNGKIEAGDALTSSPIPGVAMKATKAGRIIGFARQSFARASSTDPSGSSPIYGQSRASSTDPSGSSPIYGQSGADKSADYSAAREGLIETEISAQWHVGSSFAMDVDSFEINSTGDVSLHNSTSGSSV
ncbi:MAG: tail fiber domain-containing protein, partial [Kiritimatiellota bacterium]|nr:tail fiber domain-containing protein [Kiritimatiellota bacterium]